MDGETPAPDRAEELTVDDLLGVARSSLRAWDSIRPPFRVSAERDNTFRVGLPVAAHALNSARVAVDVWDRFPWVATANVRIALEHAFVAQWLYLTPGGPEQFVKHAAHSNLVRAQEFARAITDQPELTALVPGGDLAEFFAYAAEEPAPGKERSWGLQNLFNRFESSGLLHGSYRTLSAAIHPSTGTVSSHLDIRRTPPSIHRDGNGPTDRHETAQTLALSALWALNFVEKCDPDYKSPGLAGAIAIPKALPYDLEHSDSP